MTIKSEHVKQWRKNMKQKIVTAMGGKCQICDYNKCNDALELHHLNPNEKEFGIGAVMAKPIKWSKIAEEAKKCILLCSNCHKEVHKNITEIPSNYQLFDETLLQTKEAKEVIQMKAPIEITYCPICNKQKTKSHIYCSHSCAAKSKKHTKFNWDGVDLLDLIDNQKIPKIHIAELLGCSDVAVGRRYRKLKHAQ